MRRRLLPGLILVLVPALAAAQATSPSGSVAAAQESGGPTHPREAVAQLARAALRAPSDPRAWDGLATGLTRLAVAKETGRESIFRAMKLADSLAQPGALPVDVGATTPSGLSPSAEGGGPRRTVASWTAPWKGRVVIFRWIRSHAWGMAGLLAAVLVGVGGAILGEIRRRKARRPAKAPGQQGTHWVVRTLASSGASTWEIARRTGLSQDAVKVVLSVEKRLTCGSVG